LNGIKHYICGILCIVILIAGCGCQKTGVVDTEAPANTVVADTEAPANADGIHWLVFSTVEYEQERQAIKEWHAEAYEAMKIVLGDSYHEYPIYLTKFDLNKDGEDELIAGMIGTYWGGASVGAAIHVYFYDGEQITDEIRVTNFRMHYNILDQEDNKQIGLVPGEGDFYDFVSWGKLWKWDESNQRWDMSTDS
jgi:hypothetical protein